MNPSKNLRERGVKVDAVWDGKQGAGPTGIGSARQKQPWSMPLSLLRLRHSARRRSKTQPKPLFASYGVRASVRRL